MKNDKPMRILQIVNIMDRAGIETMLMNYYRNIDRSKMQFDFLTHRPEDGAYDEEIKSLGGKVYHAPRLMPQNYIAYFKFMKCFFEEHKEYKVIHSHIDSMSFFPLKAAKMYSNAVCIAHSHSSKIDFDYRLPIKFIAKQRLNRYADLRFACGYKAGEFLFGKKNKYELVRNAVDLDKFRYSSTIRQKVRDELDISNDTFVIGHVGRFIYIKNQLFLIDIFKEILKNNKNSILLLIGSGPDELKIRNKIKEYDLEKNVKILIDRSDVNELYQAMDIFVMPSLFEGLPVVAVEAEASGLSCVFSDKISSEVLICKNTKMLSLKNNASIWAETILNTSIERNNQAITELSNIGYDIKKGAKLLSNIYSELNEGGVMHENSNDRA